MSLADLRPISLSLRVMIAALLAVGAVLFLTVRYQLANEADHIRSKGVNLARVVTKLRDQSPAEFEQLMTFQLSDKSFAYGVLANDTGFALSEVAADGMVVPLLSERLVGKSWVQDAPRDTPQGEILEFYGPVNFAGQAGHFRLGFRKPSLDIFSGGQLPFIASLMLPVFLLVPLFLFLFKREVNPLKVVNAELGQIMTDQQQLPENMPNSADLRGFATQLNQFIDHAKGQIGEFQAEKSKLVTSEKFLGYRLHRFESIFDSLPMGVLILDQDTCVTLANSWLTAQLEVDVDELIGRKIALGLPVGDLKAHFEKHERNIGRLVGEPFCFDNEDLQMSASVHLLNEEDDASATYMVIVKDVSSEARAQQSRSEFVAHLAHELKAPLHTLSLYSEVLQSDEPQPAELEHEAANVISDEVERLARLVNNLLSMTQLEMGTLALDRHRTKLVDLVRDTTQALARSAGEKQLTFEFDLPNEVVPVLVDKDVLRIAITNLLTNAIKYTDEGGVVTVSVTESDEAVTICVADTGIGIPADAQAEIFQKFYRVDSEQMRSRNGHGLGLALARQIVELHNGSLRVESQLGEGSHFYIDLWKHAGVIQEAI